MDAAVLLSGVTALYFAAFVAALMRALTGKVLWSRTATGTAVVGLIVHTAALLLRWKASYDLGIGHAPLANFYESLVFFAWSLVFIVLILERRMETAALSVLSYPFAFLLLAFASLSPNVDARILPLVPALQSNWLTTHVVTCFLGYAGFTAAFGLGTLSLASGLLPAAAWTARLVPEEAALDEHLYRCCAFGFVFLTLGILTGSVWAHYAWGSYWSWDPKETWSLITWLVYAGLLHVRLVRGWGGKRLAGLAVAGFGCVLFTYLGVNYLPGLHSYL